MSSGTHSIASLLGQTGAPADTGRPVLGPLLAFAALVAFLLVAALTVRALLRRRRAATAEPSCGRCGYLVKGLTTFTCPECGADLREVGIVGGASRQTATPQRPPGLTGTFVKVVGWKLALVLAVYVPTACFAIDYYADHLRPITSVRIYTVELLPRSRPNAEITVALTERYTTRGRSDFRRDVDRRTVAIDLSEGPTKSHFDHDCLAGTSAYRDAAGAPRNTTGPLATELRAWMSAQGVDVAKHAVTAEIDAIATAINKADKGEFMDLLVNRSEQYFNRRSSGFTTDPVGAGHFMEFATAGAVAVGLALLAAVWLRNRKRLAAALAIAHGHAPPPALSSRPPPDPTLAPSTPTVRTLSVMFSDVKDYTARAAQESRLGILDLVRRHRDLAAPIVKRRGGRIVKSLGDGLLITFESATDAVLAGLEIQAAAAGHNRSAFAERDKLELRIAVSTGEVAQEHGDVFGETVNLASRAQQHAAPGAVLFTEVTWATINRREVPFADAGTFELKGIAEPVRLYRALPQVEPLPTRDA